MRSYTASESTSRTTAVPVAELEIGDVVVFRRVWHPDDDVVIAQVVARSANGPVVDGPDFTTPTIARTGVVQDILDVDELLGLDAEDRYHVYARQSRVLTVRTDDEVLHREGLSVAQLPRWVRFVEKVTGWDALEGGVQR